MGNKVPIQDKRLLYRAENCRGTLWGMDDQAEKLRAALKNFMRTQRLKQTPWAARAGISPGTLRKFLGGDGRSMTIRTLEKLADAAGVTVTEMLGEQASGLSSHPQAAYTPGPDLDALAYAVSTVLRHHIAELMGSIEIEHIPGLAARIAAIYERSLADRRSVS